MLDEKYRGHLPIRSQRARARAAGLLASLWTQRLALALGIPEISRLALCRSARQIVVRNVRGALRPSSLPYLDRYRSANPGDMLVGILRVAERFSLVTLDMPEHARETLILMRDDPFYPRLVVEALERCVGMPQSVPSAPRWSQPAKR